MWLSSLKFKSLYYLKPNKCLKNYSFQFYCYAECLQLMAKIEKKKINFIETKEKDAIKQILKIYCLYVVSIVILRVNVKLLQYN